VRIFWQQPLTPFFASRQCPGVAIRAAMDWTLAQVRARNVVISGFHSPLAQGRMAVVSSAVTAGRLIEARAAGRNHLVAQLASQIVVAHASPGGRLAGLCDQWREQGRPVVGLLDA
jgi:hypothetical protein